MGQVKQASDHIPNHKNSVISKGEIPLLEGNLTLLRLTWMADKINATFSFFQYLLRWSDMHTTRTTWLFSSDAETTESFQKACGSHSQLNPDTNKSEPSSLREPAKHYCVCRSRTTEPWRWRARRRLTPIQSHFTLQQTNYCRQGHGLVFHLGKESSLIHQGKASK